MEERRQFILQELKRKGKVRVYDLSRDLGCSDVTIRNEIRSMDAEGLLQRIHGGAVKIDEEVKTGERYYTESIYRHMDRKKKIAARAYQYLYDNETIIIDDASSSFYLALQIKQHPEKHLAVITNSLLVGNELASAEHVEVYMVGGHIGGHLAATMGEAAIHDMEQAHVDKAFIGVHSINFDVGLTSIGSPQMQVKKAILKSADEVYVLADSSKFGGGYLSVICPIDQVHKIITDNQISKSDIKKAEELGVSLVIAT